MITQRGENTKDSIELRRQVIDACLWMRDQGLVFGTWGNINKCLDEGNHLITPSHMNYADMRPEDLAVLFPEG